MTKSGTVTPHRAYLALGSNIGDKAGNIADATARLAASGAVQIVAQSPLYRTMPWGKADQDWFVNACIGVDTALSPQALLELCLSTELQMGRKRLEKWGPRLIDIDVLSYNIAKIATETLTLPHPLMLERAFVLVPLHDIAPDLIITGTTVREALAALDVEGIQRFA